MSSSSNDVSKEMDLSNQHWGGILRERESVLAALPGQGRKISSSSQEADTARVRKKPKSVGTGATIVLVASKKLQVGNCADLFAQAELEANRISKTLWVKCNSTRKKTNAPDERRLSLKCFSTKAEMADGTFGTCPYILNAVEATSGPTVGFVRIVKHDPRHLCGTCNDRRRGVASAVRSLQSKTLSTYIQMPGMLNGNAKQLQATLVQNDGVFMKLDQVKKHLRRQGHGVADHLASCRLLPSWVTFMKKQDPQGRCEIKTVDLDGHKTFVSLFAAPSAMMKVPVFARPFIGSFYLSLQFQDFVIHNGAALHTSPPG